MENDPPATPSFYRRNRALVWSLSVLLGPLVFLGLAWVLVDWQCKQQWQEAIQKLKDSGEHPTVESFLPKPVPDEMNFGALEPLIGITTPTGHDNEDGVPGKHRKALRDADWDRTKIDEDTPDKTFLTPGVENGVPWDVGAWAAWFRKSKVLPMPPDSGNPGRDILKAMEGGNALFEQLKAGVDRQFAQFVPEDQTTAPLLSDIMAGQPGLSELLSYSRWLSQRGLAAASAGEDEEATITLLVTLRLIECIEAEPFALNNLVAIIIHRQCQSTLWHLLRQRTATDDQLARLERCWSRFDEAKANTVALGSTRDPVFYLLNCLHHVRKYRAGENEGLWTYLPTAQSDLKIWEGDFYKRLVLMRGPESIWLGAAGKSMLFYNEHFVSPIKGGGLQVLFEHRSEFDSAVRSIGTNSGLERFFMSGSTGTHGVLLKKLQSQCRVHQARLAIALERYYLRHQRYPETLQALVPGFLPKVLPDLIDGQPMRYALTAAGRYKLWSLAMDAKDDGGVLNPDGKELDDSTISSLTSPDFKGDWVWSYERLIDDPKPEPPVTPRPNAKSKSKAKRGKI